MRVGAKDIIEKILPVVDNFERGLACCARKKKEDPFVAGNGEDLQTADDNTGRTRSESLSKR